MKNTKILFWFLIPLFAVLYLPFYNRVEPAVFGIPFFYAYQLFLVPLTAGITAWVYLSLSHKKKP